MELRRRAELSRALLKLLLNPSRRGRVVHACKRERIEVQQEYLNNPRTARGDIAPYCGVVFGHFKLPVSQYMARPVY